MRAIRVLNSSDLDDINAFLDELKDGDEYKKRLAALEAQKKEINALILVMGKVDQIEGLRVQAKDFNEGAKKASDEAAADREAAKTDATAIRADATAKANAKIAEATKQFTDREKTLVDGDASLGRREKVYAKALDDLVSREQVAENLIADARQVQAKYTKAVKELKAAIEDTARAL